MANVYAVKSGNWSDTTVWNTGALPTSADDVYANNFTVTVDVSPTVLTVRNSSGTGITAGGTFSLTNGATLTCTNTIGFGQGNCIVSSLSAPSSATLNASSSYSSGVGAHISNTGTGTLTINGNIANAPVNGTPHVANAGGVLNIVGTLSGSPGGTGAASYIVSNGIGRVNITGSLSFNFAGTGGGIINGSSGEVVFTGTITQSVSSGTGTTGSIINSGTGSVTVTGSVTNNSGFTVVTNSSSGSVTVAGTLTATSTAPVIASGSLSQNTFLTGPLIGTAQGVVANAAQRWRWIASVGSSYMTVPNSTATGYKNLFTADNTSSGSGQPSVANVRSGTVYGPSNELTGTCAVPGASSVAAGVPVDNTTGTATLTAANVRAAVGLASANLDTQFSGISSGISGLPSASAIASAVWAAATRTLTTAIDNSSTIAAAVWSYATGRTITGGTVDTLTNAPSVPSAAQIATQVRTELTPELARVANCATTQEVDDIVEGALS